MKVLAITQARSSSTRLPNKVLMKIGDKTLLEIHLERLKRCLTIDKLVVATTFNPKDNVIVNIANSLNICAIKGLEDDVLDRYYQVAKIYNPTYILRITSDCPLIDPELIDEIVNYTLANNLDYCSNNLQYSFPSGQDIEVLKFSALENAWKNADFNQREHVTTYIRENSTFNGRSIFNSDNYWSQYNCAHVRLTVDYERDFNVISNLILNMGIEKPWMDYVNFGRPLC